MDDPTPPPPPPPNQHQSRQQEGEQSPRNSFKSPNVPLIPTASRSSVLDSPPQPFLPALETLPPHQSLGQASTAGSLPQAFVQESGSPPQLPRSPHYPTPFSLRAFGYGPELEPYAHNSQGFPYPQPPGSTRAARDGLGINTSHHPVSPPWALQTQWPLPNSPSHVPLPNSPATSPRISPWVRGRRPRNIFPNTPLPVLASSSSVFSHCRIAFAVDISGSTAGRILGTEREFIRKVISQLVLSSATSILPWNHEAAPLCQPHNLYNLDSYGGTDPAVLLESHQHLAALRMSNLWFLLTDGEITSHDVNALSTTLATRGMHGVPCVIVIFDRKSSSPSSCNISVGISPFASVPNSALLFQDVAGRGACHVLATKGCFNALLPEGTEQPVLNSETTWASLPTILPESAFRDLIIPASRDLAPGELALSDDLTINYNNLFQTDLDNTQVDQLLGNQNHLQSLLLSAQSRGQSSSALSWLQRQTAISPNPTSNRLSTFDPAAAASIYRIANALQNRESIRSPEITLLQRELRETHRRNSRHLNSRIDTINMAIDSLQQAERANWSSSSLSAARQSVVDTPAGTNHTNSYLGECPICFESDTPLAILFKRPQNYNPSTAPKNTTLTFPLAAGASPEYDIISAWIVCEACSGYMVTANETPFRETATSALPLVSWAHNSALWRTALTKVLDYFNPMSQPLLPILFFAILEHHLQTKEWCIADGSSENAQRQAALRWLKSTILSEVKMSGDGAKGPLGAWITTIVTEPHNGELGLIWKYPVDGFVLMLTITRELGAEQEVLTRIVWKKLLHLVTARYLAERAQQGGGAVMMAKVDDVIPKMWEADWLKELLVGWWRPVSGREVDTLRRLKDEMEWVEAVCGPAMGRWLGYLKEVGEGRATAESIWEIKERWGTEAEEVVERPENVFGSSM